MPRSKTESASSIEAVIADAYAEGRSPSLLALYFPGHQHYKVLALCEALAAQGQLTWQASGSGQGKWPHVVNLSSLPMSGGTLADVLAVFLADTSIVSAQKRAVRSMVRLMTSAPRQCDDATLMRYATSIGARDVFSLPHQVASKLANAPVSTRANAKQQATTLRRYAARHRLIPFVFPETFRQDAWEAARKAIHGTVDAQLSTVRNRIVDLEVTRTHVLAFLGERGNDPATLSLADFNEVKRALRRKGAFSTSLRVHNAFYFLGTRCGIGPFAALRDATPVLLQHPVAQRTRGSFSDLLAMVQAHGFPSTFCSALQYHHDASRFTLAELRADLSGDRKRFPAYRVRREITAMSYKALLVDIRTYLGVAVHRVGLSPDTCSLDLLFGPQMIAILESTKAWWAERYVAGEVTAPVTSNLISVIRTAGSIAHVLLHQSLHERRTNYRAPDSVRAKARRDSEMMITKTLAEEDWWQASQDARAMAEELEARIADTLHGTAKNTWKSIEKLVDIAPLTSWLHVLDAMKLEVQRRHEARDRSFDFHWLVQQTLKLAVQISTGMRPEEMYHVRLDIQFSVDERKKRRIRLRALDRKNRVSHTVYLSEDFVPAWLLSLFLTLSRPALIEGNDDHPWLFVSRTGRPVGCRCEAADGTGRDDSAYHGRLTTEAQHWKDDMGAFFAKVNGACPDEDNYFTPYVIRNVTAAAIYATKGLHKCCDYLGDSERVVRNTYGFLSGENSDVGDLAQSHHAPATSTPKAFRWE